MGMLDKEMVLKYLSGIETNGEPINSKRMRKYKKILEEIANNPSLLAFLDKKFGEMVASYIIENEELIEDFFVENKNGSLKRDDQGNVLLNDKYIERKHNGPGIYAKSWIIYKEIPILIKELEQSCSTDTTLISEQIAREANYNVASYYPAILNGKKVIITPSFLRLDEKIVQGREISGTNMDISDNPDLIRNYLTAKGCNEEKISHIIDKYKSIMLFHIFINSRDEHNGNWGIIEGQNNTFDFTPIYDLEGGLAENKLKIRPIYIGDKYDDEAMLEFLLKSDKVMEYANTLLNIDMDKVYEDINKRKKITIPEDRKKEVNDVIEKSKIKLQKVLNIIKKEKEEEQQK